MKRYDSSQIVNRKYLRKAASNSKFQNFSLHHHRVKRNEILSLNSLENNLPSINNNRPIPIYLLYKNNKFVIKSYFGMPYKQLISLLYKQVLHYQLTKRNPKPTQDIKNIVRSILGFSTVCPNLKIDYLISIMQGSVQKSLLLECFYKRKQKDRFMTKGKSKNKNYFNLNPKNQQNNNQSNKFNYQIYNCLAIGGFSKVYLARSYQDGKFYAIKFIKKRKQKDEHIRETVLNQMKICCQMNHPFIIKMKEGFQTQKFYCMVFQYCPGGELFFLLKKIKTMSQQNARIYFIQILLGIKYIHQKNIIYRDLKPQNILIDWQGNMKIVDFGLSKKVQSNKKKTFSYCGSAEYMAPEMILRSGHNSSIDYYSLGALLFQLVTGLPPFYSKNHRELQQSIVTQQLGFPTHIQLSPEIKDILTHLLAKDQKYRLGSYSGIKQIMFHPWIGKFQQEQYLKKMLKVPYPPNLSLHNFDEQQLGDDQQQFTNQIYRQFDNSRQNNIKFCIKAQYQQILNHQQILSQLIQQILPAEKNYESSEQNSFVYDNQAIAKIYNYHKLEKATRMKKKLNKSLNQFQNTNSYQNQAKQYGRMSVSNKKVNKDERKTLKQTNSCLYKNHGFKQNKTEWNGIKNRQLAIKTYYKLLPYFNKNKMVNSGQNQFKRNLPRTNILKLKIPLNEFKQQNFDKIN